MARLPILLAPHPLLKEKAHKVKPEDATLPQLLEDMLETMRAAPGIGLAASQVGVLKRVIVVEVEKGSPLFMINPEITERADTSVEGEEGCLSFPGQYVPLQRSAWITVRYTDEQGESQKHTVEGLMARCVQHEMDHLDGVVLVDHLSSLRRTLVLRKVKKLASRR